MGRASGTMDNFEFLWYIEIVSFIFHGINSAAIMSVVALSLWIILYSRGML